MRALRYLSVIVLAIAFFQIFAVGAQADNTVYVTYYVEHGMMADGLHTTHPGAMACPYSLAFGTVVRIDGLDIGSYDSYTQKNDLFMCQDRMASGLSYRFDVWFDPSYNPTGVYHYHILGVLFDE